MPFEIETKLIIAGEDPAGLMGELADLRGTGPFLFVNRRAQALKDTYYDTPAHTLSTRGIALRTRETPEQSRPFPVKITIKRNERVEAGGAAVREELELAVTAENIPRIAQALKELPLPADPVSIRPDAVRHSLEETGLVIIQERLTTRTSLDIMTSIEPGRTIAELALDEVSYRIGGGTVLHYELEVEAAENGYQPLIEELTRLLEQDCPGRLKRWDHNKLATGFALEKLHASGKIPVPEGKIVCLESVWYDVMNILLKEQRR
jgi:hypothetical protein